MRNYKEIPKALAVVGILTSSVSDCGTTPLEVPIEDVSIDPCRFAGQKIKTSGFPGEISEELIYTQIHTKSGLCSRPNSGEIFTIDKKYYECIDKSTVFHEKMIYSFSLRHSPDKELPATNVLYTSTLFAAGVDEYNRIRRKNIKNLSDKLVIEGTIERKAGKCRLFANDLLKPK